MSALAGVLDIIARSVLGEPHDPAMRVGAITLHEHQREAVVRIRAAFREFGGALLADEPGLGKTYVALAIAQGFARTLVTAPAALRTMWQDAAAQSGVRITFISFESLSRRDANVRADLVIIDEAHHVSNTGAARYARVARAAADARVLLLTATPVRNRRTELDAVLALFLGSGAGSMAEASRSRCVIRRSAHMMIMPIIDGPHWHPSPRAPDLSFHIRSLPKPLPTLDGREARALLAMTLGRCWASSLAALDTALRRRLQRGVALHAILEAGRVPTRRELRAWVLGEDAVQLAFPGLVAHADPDAARLQEVLSRHLDAVRALRARVTPLVPGDIARRCAFLLSLRSRYAHARIVAFTTHASTAEAIYRGLRNHSGVAILTARGARSAGGFRPRDDVLVALSARADSSRTRLDDISLVVATDLLSEGVNLQGASVIVHLDLPWTPAGLEQRTGRAARIGSAFSRVHVHGLAPPRAAERLLRMAQRLQRKRAERWAGERTSTAMERLRREIALWRLRAPSSDAAGSAGFTVSAGFATVRAGCPGALAVVRSRHGNSVIGGRPGRRGTWTFSDAPGEILALVAEVRMVEGPVNATLEDAVRKGIRRWMVARSAQEASGAGSHPSRARHLLLRRIDAAVTGAPPHARADATALAVVVRARLTAAVSAGTDLLLLELAQERSTEGREWLALCDRRLAREAPPPAVLHRDAVGEIDALLLLSPAPVARRPRAPRLRATRGVST